MDWTDQLAIHAFVIALWAVVFWGAIKIFDRHNHKNTFALALGISLVNVVTDYLGLSGALSSVAWLVLLIRLLTWYYDLGLLRGAAVAVIAAFWPLAFAPVFGRLVGGDESRAVYIIYGLPIFVVGMWIMTALRRRSQAVTATDGPVPAARLTRWRRTPAAPVAVAVPVVPAAPLRAPEPMPQTRGDKPSFLG